LDLPPESIGIASALASAAVWGTGDFAGGMAARRNRPIQVLLIASLTGLLALIPLAVLRRESLPDLVGIGWSALAGVSGGLGIAVFYRALSTGPTAIVAPTAGVVGAAVPVIIGSLLEGLPTAGQLAGLIVGLAGIWLVSRGSDGTISLPRNPVLLAVGAGLAFGAFFVFIAQVEQGLLFSPLVVAKLAALLLAAVLLLASGHPLLPRPVSPLAFAAGVLDAGGNLLYLLAAQYARLDIAAVISSMYPAATVALARAILHERTSRTQALGMALCLAAVAVIAAS
jgi:drug/metabolite transporter (DMT)-like permease